MQLNITARHLDLTPALSDYVHRKVEKAQRYFDSIVWAQTILSVEKRRQIAEIIVHTPGSTFTTKGESADLYSAIDLATHKLELHLSRVKDKQRSRRKTKPGQERILSRSQSAPLGEEASREGLVEVTRALLKPRSLGQAIRDLQSNQLPLLLFIDEKTDRINALYKKGKDGYGLIETEA